MGWGQADELTHALLTVPPNIEPGEVNQTVLEGSPVSLECLASGVPAPSKAIFLHCLPPSCHLPALLPCMPLALSHLGPRLLCPRYPGLLHGTAQCCSPYLAAHGSNCLIKGLLLSLNVGPHCVGCCMCMLRDGPKELIVKTDVGYHGERKFRGVKSGNFKRASS